MAILAFVIANIIPWLPGNTHTVYQNFTIVSSISQALLLNHASSRGLDRLKQYVSATLPYLRPSVYSSHQYCLLNYRGSCVYHSIHISLSFTNFLMLARSLSLHD